jgi:hypothetical protein
MISSFYSDGFSFAYNIMSCPFVLWCRLRISVLLLMYSSSLVLPYLIYEPTRLLPKKEILNIITVTTNDSYVRVFSHVEFALRLYLLQYFLPSSVLPRRKYYYSVVTSISENISSVCSVFSMFSIVEFAFWLYLLQASVVTSVLQLSC